MAIQKTYQPAEVEGRIYQMWEASQAFRAGRPERRDAQPFTIVIPPPNVTGSLHMGHALNNTLQDVLCRFERMRGRDVLWQPGTDHAGIATQMVVERQMMERQEPHRREVGREKFLEKVWAWKAESGGTITQQLKRLGASCDWSRERFTMDEGLSKAVLKVFVELYRQGLIYKDKRLVNWDPKLLTAISDLEVQQVEVKGSLWHIKYRIEGTDNEYIIVATTRPETMLGDTAVAVHPDDERYKHLIGRHAILPLVGRRIPIVADEYSDPEKGTGAVKITPAHDFNDFEVGRRHHLPLVNVMSAEGKLALQENAAFLENVAPSDELSETLALHGVDRFAARKTIVARLEEKGLLDKVEPHTHMVPHGDRGNVPIEPFLTDQWYVNAKELSFMALAAVREGRTKFVPQNWEKTYYDWMENIQPWCISRQLWWGHQIPAWYGPDDRVFVAETEDEALAEALAWYVVNDVLTQEEADKIAESSDRRAAFLKRDEDVLDTWFSSALWPFSTLGWPEDTPEVKRYYPTNALVTGFDIIFFWVARMMMMGLHFMKEVPFDTVYIHALVRDERGAKMSKSKGNVIDPLHLIDDYGADALRFTLAAMAAQGRDIKLSTQRVEGYRNFATKLWNAARFAEVNNCALVAGFDPALCKDALNRGIVKKCAITAHQVTKAIEEYRFNDAAGAIYRLVWDEFCDWYIEFAKPKLMAGDVQAETRATTAWALDQILKLLHPFMPFITEELWNLTDEERSSPLALSTWPSLSKFEQISEQPPIDFTFDIVKAVRSTRASFKIPYQEHVITVPENFPSANTAIISVNVESISRLANTEIVLSSGTSQSTQGRFVYRVPLPSVTGANVAIGMPPSFDSEEQAQRLEGDLKKIDEEIARLEAKLNDQRFVTRAPAEVVDEQREKRSEWQAQRTEVQSALDQLKAGGVQVEPSPPLEVPASTPDEAPQAPSARSRARRTKKDKQKKDKQKKDKQKKDKQKKDKQKKRDKPSGERRTNLAKRASKKTAGKASKKGSTKSSRSKSRQKATPKAGRESSNKTNRNARKMSAAGRRSGKSKK